MKNEITEIDVLVIGAGLSGLVAAYNILEKQSTLKVIILEETTRIGGQIDTIDDIEVIRFVSEDNYHIVNLCNELGVKLKQKSLIENKFKKCWEIDNGFLSKIAKFELNRFMNEIDLICIDHYLSKSIDRRAIGITMEKYLCSKLITNQSKEIIRFIVRAVTGVEANQISMKEYLFICNTTNGITPQLDLLTSNNVMIFENGCSELIQKLTDKIGASQIFISNKVTEIIQSNDFATVKTDLGNEFLCSVVIVAIPWPKVQKINFYPPIPDQLKTQITGSKKLVSSFIVEYFESHWRRKGFSGNILSHNPHIIFYEVKPRIIAGSIYHEEFYESILKPITLQILSKHFGEEMNHPIKWEQKTWEQSIHLNFPPINKMNRVVWASTNSSTSFRGFLNGAVQSGLRSSIQALLLIRPQIIDWTDIESIQHASVVRKKIGYFKRLLASFNIYNILRYCLVIGGYYVCKNYIWK